MGAGKKPLSAPHQNQVLLQAFDDSPDISVKTLAWASIRSEQQWRREVYARLAQIGETENAQDTFERN